MEPRKKFATARLVYKEHGLPGIVRAIGWKILSPFHRALGEPLPPIGEGESKLATDAKEYWSKSESDATVRDYSHWAGEGRWADAAAWMEIGEKHFRMFESLCEHTDRSRPIKSMIEWGPGGGANAVHFAGELEEFYGVDISSVNFDECRRKLEEADFAGFHPVLIRSDNPEDCLSQIKEPCDFFLSTDVYQHFTSKEYGLRVTKLANKLLADSGIAIIQIRYDNDTVRFKPKKREYDQNVLYFTSYLIDEFWQISIDAGFRPLYITLLPATNQAYYFLQKDRALDDASNKSES